MNEPVATVFYKDDSNPTAVHKHNIYQMIFVQRGRMLFRFGETEYEVTAPSVVFIDSLEPHSVSSVGGACERYVFEMLPHRLDALRRPFLSSVFTSRTPDFLRVVEAGSFASEIGAIFSLLAGLPQQRNDSDTDFEICLLRTLLHILARRCPQNFRSPAQSAVEERVLRIKAHIESDPADSSTLDELSRKYNISPFYLSHCFRRQVGYTIKRYRLLCRISYASTLLAETDKTVTSVCRESGFENMSNFARYFKMITGKTPTEYRAYVRKSL